MKKTNNMFRMLAAGITVLSVTFLVSCNKDLQKAPVSASSAENSVSVNPVAQWGFDSTWTESVQNLKGKAHQNATYTSTNQAKLGKAALYSPKKGFVTYANAGTALPNLTQGFTVDFWVYPTKPGIEAHCIWAMPQTTDRNGIGSFWPTHHVLIDGWNPDKGDTGLIKIMFKGNKVGTNYDEQWTEIGNIPNFYKHWNHIQYAYNGTTSEFTVKVNGLVRVDHQIKYTDNPDLGGQPLGNIAPNPGPYGIIFGAFQNQWQPDKFANPEPWMHGFAGRLDAFKVYDSALF